MLKILPELVDKEGNLLKQKVKLDTADNMRILKSDTKVAKNYLQEQEAKNLESAVSGYFDYVERIIKNRTTFTMQTLADSIDKFLEFNEYETFAFIVFSSRTLYNYRTLCCKS